MNKAEAAGVNFHEIAMRKLALQHAQRALGKGSVVGGNPSGSRWKPT